MNWSMIWQWVEVRILSFGTSSELVCFLLVAFHTVLFPLLINTTYIVSSYFLHHTTSATTMQYTLFVCEYISCKRNYPPLKCVPDRHQYISVQDIIPKHATDGTMKRMHNKLLIMKVDCSYVENVLGHTPIIPIHPIRKNIR